MKRFFLTFFSILICQLSAGQRLFLETAGSDAKETATIDSIGYEKIHQNGKSVQSEVNLLKTKLERRGFLSSEIISETKPNDSTFRYQFRLGNRISRVHIYIGKDRDLKQQLFPGEPDTLKMPLSDVEPMMETKLKILERDGFSLAQMQLLNLVRSDAVITADLDIRPGNKRKIADIVIEGYDKFPKGHKKAIQRLYRNRTFNQQTLQELHDDFSKFRFINQTRYPEILFTTDTTKIYVYAEKAKPSRFDGLIGFANDEENSKLVFNGYLDVQLINFVNTGEEFNLYWKSDGQQQRTFNASIELPYIFRTQFGLRAQLNIFKQDSTFQNTKTAIELGYLLRYNTRFYIGYQTTESSDIQNQNSFSINDYQNRFFTIGGNHIGYKPTDFLFPEKTRLSVKAGFGSRDSNLQKNDQFFAEADLRHNFYLNDKNIFTVRSQDYYLSSDTYTVNEMFRFGGINSIRGFNENSLQANLLTSILTEYRYVLAPNLYVHSIFDYGYFSDDATDNSGRLLGIGFGFGLLTKTGLLNLVYANGSTGDQQIKLSNSVVQFSLKANF